MATVQLPAKRAPGAPWSLIALIAVGAIALVAVAALGYQAVSGGTASSPITIPGVSTTADSVTVVATGEVAAAPDMMTVYIGAAVRRPTAREALQVASTEAASLADYLKQQGVDPKDIQTQYVNIWRGTDDGGRSYYYSASNQLRVVLRDLSKAGAIIAGAADSLGNDVSINSMSLSRQDSSAQIAQARDLAMKTANTRAGEWSKLTGRKLGSVLAVNEGNFGYTNYRQGQYGGIGGGGGVPIEAGEGTVSVQIAVTYRLD